MAIDPVSKVQPIQSARPLSQLSRPPETTPDARESARQENDSRRIAVSDGGASPATLQGPAESRVSVIAVPNDAEGSLQAASAQVSRAYQGGEPSPSQMRSASDAYRVEAGARDDLARQQQGNGARSLDVMA